MNKLMRRVALALGLPLVIGAPVVLLASPAHAAMTFTQVVVSDSTPVYGQEVFATATVQSEEEPVTVGTVQFLVENPAGEFTQFGGPVPLNAAGQAVSVPVPQQDGMPMNVTVGSDFYTVRADYQPPSSAFDPSSGFFAPISVSQAGSSLAVLPGPTSIVADLSGALPGGVQAGSIKPSGTVTFTVGGATVGTAPVAANGRATINFVVPPGAARQVGASYPGDDRYTGSSQSMIRFDPEITARVLSKFPKSKSGWYRTPVDISFSCRPHGSELAEDCPAEVRLKKSAKGQSVSRTIHAVDGGADTVVVDDIDIDRGKPQIKIVDGKCKATDELSGVKTCRLRIGQDGHFIAVATDKAGNRAVLRGVLD